MENRGKSTKGFKCFKPPAVTGDDVACAEERKTKGRRRSTLYGAFKALLSKTSLMKKNPSENSSKSKNDHHPKEKSSDKYDIKEIIGRSSSDDSSIYSSYSRDTPSTSACSSSRSSFMSTSNAVSEPEQSKQSTSHDNSAHKHRKVSKGRKINRRDHIMKRNNMDDYSYMPKIEALCVVMVCLAALIFCNKGYAIATCTLIWLVLVMGRRPKKTLQRGYSSEENDLHIDSKDYKKKVIMQGLLERNRPRQLLHS